MLVSSRLRAAVSSAQPHHRGEERQRAPCWPWRTAERSSCPAGAAETSSHLFNQPPEHPWGVQVCPGATQGTDHNMHCVDSVRELFTTHLIIGVWCLPVLTGYCRELTHQCMNHTCVQLTPCSGPRCEVTYSHGHGWEQSEVQSAEVSFGLVEGNASDKLSFILLKMMLLPCLWF